MSKSEWIPYGKQNISDDDIKNVVEVLKSDWLTQGKKVPEFEQTVSEYVGCKHAVAANSATSALHIAYLALNLGKGDLLWTVPNTFVATSNAALMCGAEVDFVDIDPFTYNISIDCLERKLEDAKRGGRLPKVIVPVHFSGRSCEMKKINELKKKYGFFIVEDASHAIGAEYEGKKVGSCEYSDIAVFSFHPVKIITTGEGGVATTNDPRLFERMTSLRTHGIERESSKLKNKSDGPWYFEQHELGYNYRMTDFQAALGISQFKRLESFINRRKGIADLYNRLLNELPITLPEINNDRSSWHLYVVRIKDEAVISRNQVYERLREEGIGVMVHYIPVYKQPFYKDLNPEWSFPNMNEYYRTCITLPCFFDLSNEQVNIVASKLKEIIKT